MSSLKITDLRPKSITSFPVASLYQVGAGKNPLCLSCRIVSQIPLQRHVANKWQQVYGNVCNGFWALLAVLELIIGGLSKQTIVSPA